MIHAKMYINGTWIGNDNTKTVYNPADNTPCGTVPIADTEQVEQALQSARMAFMDFSKWSPVRRSKLLSKIGKIVRNRAKPIGRIMTIEQGKPLYEAIGEIHKLADSFDFYGAEATRIHGEIIASEDTDIYSFVSREPIGVVAAITPWNYPAELIGWKVCAGLAAGCTIVIKPPTLTPLCPIAIMECIHDAGVPAGVVNLVTGGGSTVGQYLIEHPLVDKIAFTGSSATGLHIQQSLQDIKRVSLELGGNCPMAVTKSADLDSAVAGAVRRSFRNCGQICIAINRIYVHHSIYKEFLEKFANATRKLVVDNGLTNPSADMGAICSAEVLEKTKSHMQDAISKGANLVAGGNVPTGEQYKNGMFFRPTIVADCTHDMHIMREETFGPIVGVMCYQDDRMCVDLMNDTPYGLASYVYSQDIHQIKQFSRQLHYGNVAINTVDAGIINAPYGGWKQSGIGVEHGRAGMLEYFNYKHTRIKI